MKLLRSLYDWVLELSNHKSGPLALFILAMAESIFFPIPPDVLLIALAIGSRRKAFLFGFLCVLGSIIGAVIGYLIGYHAWWSTVGNYSPFAMFFFDHIPGFTHASFTRISELYNQYNFYIIFTAGFTPLPYKVFTLTAGAYAINFPLFIIASIVSRSTRFLLIAALIWKFGSPIKAIIDKYFNIVAIIFTVLLIGSFVVLKYLL